MFSPDPNNSTPEAVSQVLDLLAELRLPLEDEKRLQAELGEALESAGISFSREHELSPRDRVDFMLAGNVAVECKLRAGKRQIYRQLRRYAESPRVSALLLITNTAMGLPSTIEGKPTYYCSLGSAWL